MINATSENISASRQTVSGKFFSKITILHALILSIIFASCSVAFHHGGFAHIEVQRYLPYYLSNKPLLNKIYDSQIVDFDAYTGRELSYLFDYFDCKFIELGVSLGHPHFLSITTYCFLIGIALILWHFAVRLLRLSPFIGLAIISLFWTSPTIFLAGSYFRSAKYGAAFATAVLYLILYKILVPQQTTKESRLSKSTWIGLFAMSWIATLFDRQGVYFVGVAICFLILWRSIYPQKNILLLLSPFVAALILSSIYIRYIAPTLTETLNHYPVNKDYQDLLWYNLLDFPERYFLQGFLIFIDTLRFMLGCIPAWTTMLGLACLFGGLIIRSNKETKTAGKMQNTTAVAFLFLFCSVFLIVILNSIMLLRLWELSFDDVRRVYYWVPTVTLLSFSLTLGLAHWNRLKETTKCILLIVAVAGNIYAIPQHEHIVETGHLKDSFELSPRLLDALRKLEDPDFQPAADVAITPIYQHFRYHTTER